MFGNSHKRPPPDSANSNLPARSSVWTGRNNSAADNLRLRLAVENYSNFLRLRGASFKERNNINRFVPSTFSETSDDIARVYRIFVSENFGWKPSRDRRRRACRTNFVANFTREHIRCRLIIPITGVTLWRNRQTSARFEFTNYELTGGVSPPSDSENVVVNEIRSGAGDTRNWKNRRRISREKRPIRFIEPKSAENGLKPPEPINNGVCYGDGCIRNFGERFEKTGR